MAIITIGRQVGSGGRIVGRILAGRLGYQFLDRELLKKAAERSGIRSEFFERTDEVNNWWQDAIYNNVLSGDALFRWQAEAIRAAAQEAESAGSGAVFMGRCADFVLREMPHKLDVFVAADRPDRVKRVMEYLSLGEAAASKHIDQTEKGRRNYYNFYTGKQWGMPLSYDICLNATKFSPEQCADLVIDALRYV